MKKRREKGIIIDKREEKRREYVKRGKGRERERRKG